MKGRLEFANKVSRVVTVMGVPAVGVLQDPKKRLDRTRAEGLANAVAHLLRQVLE